METIADFNWQTRRISGILIGMRRLVPIAVFLLWSPATAPAALDPEVSKPYHLQVVLRIAPRRLLTDVFRDQVKRELRDGLQAGFKDMVRVEVVEDHPLLQEIEARGLQQALDGWKQVSDTKTHFVLIDCADGRYVIQARQHDGMTGLASPVVRRAQTTDRQFVARSAALLIDRDLGIVGTIQPEAGGTDVRVLLKGSRLGVPMERWVKKDEVFALVPVSQVGGETRTFRVPWALLQAVEDPKETGVRCRLYHRYKDPLSGGPALLGHRCLKLGTTRTPLQLRLVDDRFSRPLPDQALAVSRYDFDSKVEEEHSTDADGLMRTKLPYMHIAFVRVLAGASVRARVPVEILDNHLVVVPISINPQAEILGQIDLQKKQWIDQLYESLTVTGALFKELNRLVEKKAHAAALKKAQAGLATVQADLAGRAAELRGLQAAAGDLGPGARLDLGEGEQRLQELQARRDELQRFVVNLENVVKEASDPRRAELLGMVEQARLLESEADYDRAIALYKKMLELSGVQPAIHAQVEGRLKELEQAWKLKNEQHRRARLFIYETWPKQEAPGRIGARIGEAQRMFQVCRDTHDVLSPRMLLKANLAHTTRLKKRLETLQPNDNEDDRAEAIVITEVAEHLRKLTEDAASFLRQAEAGPK